MEFCPNCSNLLQFETQSMNHFARFFCRTCPYVYPIPNKKIERKMRLPEKEKGPDLSGEKNAGSNPVPTTKATCPKCGHDKAAYHQQQTRSADEPMTIFYSCMECQHKWRED